MNILIIFSKMDENIINLIKCPITLDVFNESVMFDDILYILLKN